MPRVPWSRAGYLIYALIDPRTDLVRYIGKSCKGLHRAKSHTYESNLSIDPNSRKVGWIRELQSLGMKYRIAVLDMLPEPTGLDELERYWISRGRAEGWPLLNITGGGEGLLGVPKTAEVRRKIGAANARFHRLHPDAYPTGDAHYSRRNPELVSRGDSHYSRTNPERLQRGERRPAAKLTEESVREIRRRAARRNQSALAREFGVSGTCVSGIVHRTRWAHVTD